MPAQESDEDVIDLQDLQAQIDLSMSFAQNLITSWVKPTHYSQSCRQRDLENEIKEYMRRPARLGVGAPIPENQSLVREASRLKSRLEGVKKRQREEEGAEAIRRQSDDEEESRAGAIKEKTRLDPFHIPPKNKRRHRVVKGAHATPIKPIAAELISQPQLDMAMEDEPDADEVARVLLSAPESSPPGVPEKKKPKLDFTGTKQQELVTSPDLPLLTKADQIVNEKKTSQIPSLNLKTFDTPSSSRIRSPSNSPAGRTKMVDVSLTATPLLSPGHRTTNANLLKQPLLNLDGSASENGTDIEKPSMTGPTPKKKRKRRKKKKSLQNAEAPLSKD